MKQCRLHIIFLLTTCLLLGVKAAMSQVTVNFSPAIHGQTMEGLVYAQIFNSYTTDLMAKLTIRVRDTKGYAVVTVTVPPFMIRPGMNPINKSAFSNARFSFGNNDFGFMLSQSGRFPEGEYEYCFEVDISDSKNPQLSPIHENCMISRLQPRTPLLLINPVDGEDFCNKRPNFMWQPPIPLPREARYRFVLSQLREKQDIVEAINYNPPIVNQGNLIGNTLLYPASAPALLEGQRYVWQVIVYAGKTILARSEVWTFTFKCNEQKPYISDDSYRELKETNDGNFYVAARHLRFSINNPYGPSALEYTIASMANPETGVKRLPKLVMAAGLNKYDIDLSEYGSFKNNEEYLLKVSLPNNRNLYLRFIYKEE